MGAWIEIAQKDRLCGLSIVAPLVGAWIEILSCTRPAHPVGVAPLVGAWIEIMSAQDMELERESLPLWERGLKYTKMRG